MVIPLYGGNFVCPHFMYFSKDSAATDCVTDFQTMLIIAQKGAFEQKHLHMSIIITTFANELINGDVAYAC